MKSIELSKKIRKNSLILCSNSNTSHIASCLSIADILAVLYEYFLDNNKFILSKGHAAAALYSVLFEKGYISYDDLLTYCQSGSYLIGHSSHKIPGVTLSTGSLGHGLPVACGIALANTAKIYALMGDGEMNEGSNWEAAMFAAHHKLTNCIALVDCNNLQGMGYTKNIINMNSLSDKWSSFGWNVRISNGHIHTLIKESLENISEIKPTVILYQTVKGKGVSFVEDNNLWHYKSMDKPLLEKALLELS